MISLTIKDCEIHSIRQDTIHKGPRPVSEVTIVGTGIVEGMHTDMALNIKVANDTPAEFDRMIEEIIKGFTRRGVYQDECPLQSDDQHD